jgi:alpha-L-fucosidase 2
MKRFILIIIMLTSVARAQELGLWYTKPARQWEEALPIGSGRLGAMVFGGVAEERIQFNEGGQASRLCARGRG